MIDEKLSQSLETFRSKEQEYGKVYEQFGDVMAVLFPDGITIKGAREFARFGEFRMLMSKMIRYANNLENGGHQDSAHDMIVCAAILEELTDEK